MHLNAKKMAVTGLLLAFNVVLIIVSGVLEFNTLFLLGAASFLVGIVVREYGMKAGGAFYLAAVFLGLLTAPNKMYCFTFAAMGLYVLGTELIFRLLGKLDETFRRRSVFWIFKYLLFNIIYLPVLFFMPKLLFAGGLKGTFLIIAVFAGQAVLIIYDKAYEYFQAHIWSKYRKTCGF